MALRCACVDIGTNTTRLLVADRVPGGLRTVAVERAFVPLGPRSSDSAVPAATAEALIAAVRGQLSVARHHGAERIRVVGTAALRTAIDPAGLCAMVQAGVGATVEILSPGEEARLAFLGATGTLPDPLGPDAEVAVIDIGGGSVEIAIGTVGGGVRWWTSVPTGSAALTAAHVHSDPPSASELAALRAAVATACSELRPPRPEAVFAVGGSAASLPRIVGARVTPEAAERAVALLTGGPAAAVGAEHALDPRRVRVLPAGILLLAAAGRVLGSAPIVARGGLREGVVLDTG